MKDHAQNHLLKLCEEIGARPVGSRSNHDAVEYISSVFEEYDWQVDRPRFNAMDWHAGNTYIEIQGTCFAAVPGAYTLGCNCSAKLVIVSTKTELEQAECENLVLLLHGEIAGEQLFPKNFVFYNTPENLEMIKLIENKNPVCVITMPAAHSEVAGGEYPFSIFEDGDVDIPNVCIAIEEGRRLLDYAGQQITVSCDARREDSYGENSIANNTAPKDVKRICISAHIDTKSNTPGALDNAAGCTVLCLLAELLKDVDVPVELLAFNGEDYYSVPGQMLYLAENRFENCILNINIDGLGLKGSNPSVSFYNLPDESLDKGRKLLSQFTGFLEGAIWYSGDHCVFLQQGIPAIAFTSDLLLEGSQSITHTPGDIAELVDISVLNDAARLISDLLQDLYPLLSREEQK